jgi:hypothetical protein
MVLTPVRHQSIAGIAAHLSETIRLLNNGVVWVLGDAESVKEVISARHFL